jgi:hypothetical protein
MVEIGPGGGVVDLGDLGSRDSLTRTALARSRDGAFLYAAGRSMHKVDLSLEPPASVLEGSSSRTHDHLEIDPSDSRIYLAGGETRRTDSFSLAGAVAEGVQDFGDDPGIVYVATEPSSIEVWDTRSFTKKDELHLPCSVSDFEELITMPGGKGWLALGNDKICGLILDGDGDGVYGGADNCPTEANPEQTDSDGDGFGDACDGPCRLDLDGDGAAAPLSDGLLALRHWFGFDGLALTVGVIPLGALRSDPSKLGAHLDACGASMLDVDGDGEVLPMTDGILLLRYLFGFGGEVLIEGAIGAACTRCNAVEIENHLASFGPSP